MTIPRLIPLCLLACGLPAQILTDEFETPGTSQDPVPGWTVQTGDWEIYRGRLVSDGSGKQHWITWDAAGLPRNCVIDAEVFRMRGTLQYAGITARYSAPTLNLFAKAQQNNGANNGFDRLYTYEYRLNTNNVTANLVIKQPAAAAQLRLVVADNFFWTEFDGDRDGHFEQRLGPQTIQQLLGGARVGMGIWGWSEIDNVEFFNAVLTENPLTKPRVGTTYKLDLRGPDATPRQYILGFSAGNDGFDLGPARIPLSADTLLDLSLTLGFRGLVPTSGKATISLPIPNLPALVGNAFYAAAVLLDPSAPVQIGAVSNELRIEVQK